MTIAPISESSVPQLERLLSLTPCKEANLFLYHVIISKEQVVCLVKYVRAVFVMPHSRRMRQLFTCASSPKEGFGVYCALNTKLIISPLAVGPIQP